MLGDPLLLLEQLPPSCLQNGSAVIQSKALPSC